MRLLFISTMGGAPWGGSEELWVKSAEYALEKGHEVFVSIYKWDKVHHKVKILHDKGATIIFRTRVFYGTSNISRVRGKLNKILFSSREIKKLAKLKPHSIVISQGTVFECMSPEFLVLKENSGAEFIIITQANSEYDTIPSHCFGVGRKLFSQAQKLYFVSKRNLKVAERQLAMNFPNAHTISNPANIKNSQVCEWNNSVDLNFAFVGRLNSSVKGLGVLIQIFSEKAWASRKWKLNLYGSGEDENYLRELVKLYNLEEKIVFHGFIQEIHEVWKINHVLVMPSTLEGTPLSLIEAMLCGRCAVVSDVGGNAELIKEGFNGYIAEAPSVISFGNALERFWVNHMNAEKLGLEARKTILVKVNFQSYKSIIDQME